MPAKIIPLAQQQKTQIRTLVDNILNDNPPHPDPDVVACVKTELEKILEKYFIDDAPEFTLTLPDNLTHEQFVTIKSSVNRIFSVHNEQQIKRSNAIFRDLYLSKLEICALRKKQGMPNGSC